MAGPKLTPYQQQQAAQARAANRTSALNRSDMTSRNRGKAMDDMVAASTPHPQGIHPSQKGSGPIPGSGFSLPTLHLGEHLTQAPPIKRILGGGR